MNKVEKKIMDMVTDLPKDDQANVLNYIEFMFNKAKAEGRLNSVEDPLEIPRPEEEKVVAAIKRLTKTYPMLKRAKLLNHTSPLMAAHVMEGREAKAVIDDLEVVFREQYEIHVKEKQAD